MGSFANIQPCCEIFPKVVNKLFNDSNGKATKFVRIPT
jgi:hypothetical protein